MQLTEELRNSVFMKACRRERTSRAPIWLMRQAGRYQPSYRELRSKVSFLELCKTPELAAKVTLDAIEQFGFDAAIIFSDILIVLEPMGADLEYVGGSKPQIHNPVRTPSEIDALREVESVETLSYTYDAIKLTRENLPEDVPLIAFCGAPFTLASYLIEGGGSKNYVHTKRLMYSDKGAWNELMRKITQVLIAHLDAQAEAGAQVLQMFDSWVGCLSPEDYAEYVLPHSKAVFDGIKKGVPTIHFGTGTGEFLDLMREAGGDVVGVDWHTPLDRGWAKIGHDRAVQGNLDPVKLFAPKEFLLAEAELILRQAAGRAGHIFNLGHGILPETPTENVKALVEFVKSRSTTDFGLGNAE